MVGFVFGNGEGFIPYINMIVCGIDLVSCKGLCVLFFWSE